jgi:hypothetical protein
MLHCNSQHLRILGLLVGVTALGVTLAGCGGGDDSSTPPAGGTKGAKASGGSPDDGSGSSSGGAPGGPSMAGSGGGGGPMGSSGGGMGGGLGGGGQQAAATGGPPPKDQTPPPGARPDPFRPWWDTRPIPPPVLSFTAPIRIASANTAKPDVQPGIEIQEVPNRRVAGILTGNGIYALLDGGPGDPMVVKPGDVTADGYRVVMINSSSVTLKKTVNTQTFTQVVPLSDAGATTQMSSPGGGFNPGGQSGPGSFGGPAGLGARGRGLVE